ncbi:hypothetical protein EY04_17150 [Pseudomonas chlororaphis]|uniref:hypothetical protein n=1 Tax=Pseudomonas chlororaphis TaxID=587753 RepID=UPI0004AC0C9A|nr:hypothetical protein [Pseudomonas chlororaphis]AIC20570.1 hypothetical protein EY04_17150 [Pseudomonas chlororaphis]
MKLRVMTIGIYDDAQEAGKQRVYGDVDLDFDLEGISGGSRCGINFEIEGARDMTYSQLEGLILEKLQVAMK